MLNFWEVLLFHLLGNDIYRSGSGKMMRTRPDPDPEYCIYDKIFTLLLSQWTPAMDTIPFRSLKYFLYINFRIPYASWTY